MKATESSVAGSGPVTALESLQCSLTSSVMRKVKDTIDPLLVKRKKCRPL